MASPYTDRHGQQVCLGDLLRYDIRGGSRGNEPGEVIALNGRWHVDHLVDYIPLDDLDDFEIIGGTAHNDGR